MNTKQTMKIKLIIMKKIFLYIILLLCFNNLYSNPTISQFEIYPKSITNGQVPVSYLNSTSGDFTIRILRGINTQGQWESITSLSIQLVYSEGTSEIALTESFNYSSTNFNGNILDISKQFTIAAGKVGGIIKIKFSYNCFHTGGTIYGPNYSIIGYTTFVPSTPAVVNGSVIGNTTTGAVFIGIDGVHRQIVNMGQSDCIFNGSKIAQVIFNQTVNPSPIGNQLGGTITYTEWVFPINRPPFQVTRTTSGNPLLVQDALTGKIYFVEKVGGPGLSYNARWIVNQETFNYYKFDASKISIQTINWNGPGPFVPTDGWNLGSSLSMP